MVINEGNPKKATGDRIRCVKDPRIDRVTFLLICLLTDGKIIIDNILYILNIIIDNR